MKLSAALYLALGVLGFTAAVIVPIVIYRTGTPSLALWAGVASPGALSSSHAFLGTDCESCHTPNQGINAVSCITCHAPAAAVLAKPSTAFHASVGECRGCHVEHQGSVPRPVTMDHSILTRVGLRAVAAGSVPGQASMPGETLAQRAMRDGGALAPPTDATVLDCASCHSVRDKHLGFFGPRCADCHGVETWKIAGYLHPSPQSKDCNQCHKAPPSHSMMHFTMMDRTISGQSGATVEQCFMCHQTDAFNDIKGVGWFKMH